MDDITQRDLRSLVHATADQSTLDCLAGLSAESLFDHRDGLGNEEVCRLTYRRLRRLGEQLGPSSKLLADPSRLFTTLEWCSVTSPSLFLATTLHTCLGLGAIDEFGAGRDDIGDWIGELDSMNSFGSLLVTETGLGNSHIGIRTEAVHDPLTGEFVLHTPDAQAAKLMPNVGLDGVRKLGVVYARLLTSGEDRGVFGFVVPIRDENGPLPGVSITALPEVPFLPLDYATIGFDRVRISARSLLHDSARLEPDGRFHDPLGGPEERLLRSLDVRHRAWAASAAALAAAIRTTAALAVRFAADRRTLSRSAPEQPVLSYRSQQLPLFDALAQSYALTSLVNRVKREWSGAASDPDPSWSSGFRRTIGLVKAHCGAAAERIASECGQRCGSHGMFAVNRFVGYLGLGHVLGPAAGDSRLITLEAARAMAAGTAYRPPSPRITQPNRRDVSQPRIALDLIALRERGLHETLADGMRTAVRRGQPPFEAWNNRSWLASEFVETHVTRLALEALLADADRLRDGRGKDAVTRLASFFALRHIAGNSGWYLAEEVLTPQQVRMIPVALNLLCERIHPDAVSLADALLLPGSTVTAAAQFSPSS
ncbi:acyl-CoA dehydrogenase [Lentzea roselyniae]|uniref:Acyl-CoA dehydrogenase n=1 Tax=Lentzea roselyniae TaxID=531940 RepID=A0ABP7CEM7_9PSEU